MKKLLAIGLAALGLTAFTPQPAKAGVTFGFSFGPGYYYPGYYPDYYYGPSYYYYRPYYYRSWYYAPIDTGIITIAGTIGIDQE